MVIMLVVRHHQVGVNCVSRQKCYRTVCTVCVLGNTPQRSYSMASFLNRHLEPNRHYPGIQHYPCRHSPSYLHQDCYLGKTHCPATSGKSGSVSAGHRDYISPDRSRKMGHLFGHGQHLDKDSQPANNVIAGKEKIQKRTISSSSGSRSSSRKSDRSRRTSRTSSSTSSSGSSSSGSSKSSSSDCSSSRTSESSSSDDSAGKKNKKHKKKQFQKDCGDKEKDEEKNRGEQKKSKKKKGDKDKDGKGRKSGDDDDDDDGGDKESKDKVTKRKKEKRLEEEDEREKDSTEKQPEKKKNNKNKKKESKKTKDSVRKQSVAEMSKIDTNEDTEQSKVDDGKNKKMKKESKVKKEVEVYEMDGSHVENEPDDRNSNKQNLEYEKGKLCEETEVQECITKRKKAKKSETGSEDEKEASGKKAGLDEGAEKNKSDADETKDEKNDEDGESVENAVHYGKFEASDRKEVGCGKTEPKFETRPEPFLPKSRTEVKRTGPLINDVRKISDVMKPARKVDDTGVAFINDSGTQINILGRYPTEQLLGSLDQLQWRSLVCYTACNSICFFCHHNVTVFHFSIFVIYDELEC